MKKSGLQARYFDEMSNDEQDALTLKIVYCFPTIGKHFNYIADNSFTLDDVFLGY